MLWKELHFLKTSVRKGFSEKMITEQTLVGDKGSVFQATRANAKALRQE